MSTWTFRDTLLGHKGEGHRRESDPLHHATVKAVVLGKLAKSIDGFLRHQAKVGRALSDMGLSQATDSPVKSLTGESLEKESAATVIVALSLDDIVA